MCGHVVIMGQDIWIDCEVNREWWHDPGPLIDFRWLKFKDEATGPHPEPWKVELTRIVQILDAVGQLNIDRDTASQLGMMAADAGNAIARSADLEIQFTWEDHGGHHE